MSFEVYVQWYDAGVEVGISLSRIKEEFGCALRKSGCDDWILYYDERTNCDLGISPDEDGICVGLCVFRPCTDMRLWNSLFQLLQLEYGILYWPDVEASSVVAYHNPENHFPPDMLESLGGPIVVSSGRDIVEIITGS